MNRFKEISIGILVVLGIGFIIQHASSSFYSIDYGESINLTETSYWGIKTNTYDVKYFHEYANDDVTDEGWYCKLLTTHYPFGKIVVHKKSKWGLITFDEPDIIEYPER